MTNQKQEKSNSVTPVQVRMARAGLGWGVRDLAAMAGLGTNTVARFERGEELKPETVQAIRQTLENAGVELIDGATPGLRLHAHRLLLQAFIEIRPDKRNPQGSLRKRLAKRADYGREPPEIGAMLTWGCRVPGDFTDDELAVVEAAFARFGKAAPSKGIADCCGKMIATAGRHGRGRR